MTTSEVLIEIDKMLLLLGPERPLMALVTPIVDTDFDRLSPKVLANAGDGKARELLTSWMGQARSRVKGTKPSDAFRIFVKFSDQVESIERALAAELAWLSSTFTDFERTYSEHLNQQNDVNLVRVVHAARQYSSASNAVREVLMALRANLAVREPATPDREALWLLLDSELSLSDFWRRLQVLSDLYEEIGTLVAVSVAEYPLQVAKIESGSFSVQAIGHAIIVRLLRTTLSRAAKHLQDAFTRQGKIASVARQPQKIPLHHRRRSSWCRTGFRNSPSGCLCRSHVRRNRTKRIPTARGLQPRNPPIRSLVRDAAIRRYGQGFCLAASVRRRRGAALEWSDQPGLHHLVYGPTSARHESRPSSGAGSCNGARAYLSVGAGAAGLTGGVDVRGGDSLVGVGGEFGLGQLLVGSLTGSLHPMSNRTNRPIDPFVTVSLTGLASSPYSAQGMSVGGGVTAWFSRRLGLRVDGFRFWPVFGEEEVTPAEFSPKLWGARVGLAFRFG